MFPPPPPLVPAPPPPLPAHPPLYRDPQDALSRREAEALVDSLVAKKIAAMAAAELIPVKQGDPGEPGPRGVTFTPHVSSAGVLSWTNDGGLANPEPVVVKGLKGDPGLDGTVNAQTLASVNAALANFQNAYSQLSAAVAAAQNAAAAAATARTDANAAAAALSSLSGMQTLPARVAALELDYGNYLNQIRSPNALHKVKVLNSGVSVVETTEFGLPTFVTSQGCRITGPNGDWNDGSGAYVSFRSIVVDSKQIGESYAYRFWITDMDVQVPPPGWIGDYFNEEFAKTWYMRSAANSDVPEYLIHGPTGISFLIHEWESVSPVLEADYETVVTSGTTMLKRAWKTTQYPITVGSTPVASSQSNDWTD